MRIVDVNEFYSPTGGGVRTYVDRKMELMAELGHELIVIAPGKRDWIDARPAGRVIYVKAPPMPFDANYGLFWSAAPVTRLLDELAPDLVEASSPWRPAWIVGRWRGAAPRVFFMHNDNLKAYVERWFEGLASPAWVERRFAWYSRYINDFLKYYDAVLTNGPALAKRLARRGVRIDAAMPLGIERGHFSPALRDQGLRASMLAELGLPPTAHVLLDLGRHHPEKRWPMVIEAVARARRDLPVGLILIGDGYERRRIEKLIAPHRNIVLWRPIYDRLQLARVLASADALIHGSEGEPFGLVASEAIASGLPLIAPDEGGCAEVAAPQASALYRAKDPAAAAAAIARLFAGDREELRRAALAAAARVRTDADHCRELMAYYQALIAQGRRAVVAKP
ncbi:MAG: glycosyl transferase family 1 [Proteobacteria bacterium SG_bin5]|nr:glycosyltransferase [Sphingomonas sp.]OQW43978.1 MAG: glycosyl transferase family 1 [Proteobacteria bacterium SG_bin5]